MEMKDPIANLREDPLFRCVSFQKLKTIGKS